MYIIYILMFVLVLLIISAIVLHLLTVITAKETTTAIIIDLIPRSYVDRSIHVDITSYTPVFEFFVNEKSYIVESTEAYTYNKYTIGQRIKINYRKKNPNDAYIYENRKHIIKTSIMALLFVFMMILYYFLRVKFMN